MDYESGNGIQTNEKINSEISCVNRTKREIRINHLPGGWKRSHQGSPNDEKERQTNAHLLRQPYITRARNQLHSNEEADTCIEELKEKSIDEKEVLAVVEEEGRTWMTPIHEYLTEEILPEEKRKARAIRRKAGTMAGVDVNTLTMEQNLALS
ncbi:hypothetical protein Tco_0442688 [Tanacetum coccineum]